MDNKDSDHLAASIDRLAQAIVQLAHSAHHHEMPADSQAALDLVLHNSRRIARRLARLDAETPAPSTPTQT